MEIIQFENQLAKSNCFLVVDWVSNSCIIIDPASYYSKNEISYIEEKSLTLDYVILTHEHADHCWGVNSLRESFPNLKLVYAEACNQKMKKEVNLFLRLYIDDPNYTYEVAPAEIQIKEKEETLDWHGNIIRFIQTPGHSPGSMCIQIGKKLFTGDTIMPYPPYFNGRGSCKVVWAKSVKMIEERYNSDIDVYPGHGKVIKLGEWSNSEFSRTK